MINVNSELPAASVCLSVASAQYGPSRSEIPSDASGQMQSKIKAQIRD